MKGKTNNPHGRRKGSPNKATSQTRAAIVELLESRLPRINQRLDECEAKDELNILIKLIELVIPKPQPENMEAAPKTKDFYSNLLVQLNPKMESK